MIAIIGKGSNLYGALAYNQSKVEQENGTVIGVENMYETLDGSYTVARLMASFETRLTANRNTEKPVLHLSLNPDPDDKVSDGQYREIADRYMQEMGYGNQPYVIFKHTDTERTHIHIVSVCVDEEGRKISDTFEKRRSMNICRELEQKYGLIPATEKQRTAKEPVFRPVDHKENDIKSQMASVVRYLPKYYQFQTIGAYNALLSLFHIAAEQVRGELHGRERKGLVYFALNEKGEKASNPFKASRFGRYAGLPALEKHFETSKEQMKASPAKAVLKNTVEAAMNISTGETEFKKQLVEHGINTVIRRNDEGRIYGITFIDHESRTVWNGSQLSRSLSANTFNDLWKEQASEQYQKPVSTDTESPLAGKSVTQEQEQVHPFFAFMDEESSVYPMDGFGWLSILPQAQGQDYQEPDFEYQKKKKKRRKRGYRY